MLSLRELFNKNIYVLYAIQRIRQEKININSMWDLHQLLSINEAQACTLAATESKL